MAVKTIRVLKRTETIQRRNGECIHDVYFCGKDGVVIAQRYSGTGFELELPSNVIGYAPKESIYARALKCSRKAEYKELFTKLGITKDSRITEYIDLSL